MPRYFRDRFEKGVWLGCTTRSGEHLVSTQAGVFKVISIQRCPEDCRWSADMIKAVVGSRQEPVLGSGSSQVVAYAKKREETGQRSKPELVPQGTWEQEPEVRVFYTFKKDIDKHGPTVGCPGCRALMAGGKT